MRDRMTGEKPEAEGKGRGFGGAGICRWLDFGGERGVRQGLGCCRRLGFLDYGKNPRQPRFSQEDAPSPSLAALQQVEVSNCLFIELFIHSEMSIAQ